MKTCALCNIRNAKDSPTCISCGCADWLPTVVETVGEVTTIGEVVTVPTAVASESTLGNSPEKRDEEEALPSSPASDTAHVVAQDTLSAPAAAQPQAPVGPKRGRTRQ